MDKILIMKDEKESDSYLIQCLNLLFPECKVEIREKQDGSNNRLSQIDGDKGALATEYIKSRVSLGGQQG